MKRHQLHRRDFIRAACLSAACAGAVKSAPGALRTSLNAYSFNKMLNDNIKGRGEGVTLLQVVEFAARCGFEGIDPTAYFFPGYPDAPTDAYIATLKRRAADLGLGISGTGVRNNFTTADK